MDESNDRKELERRLEQARRIADLALDPLTKERLQRLVQELEEQLRLSEAGTAGRLWSFRLCSFAFLWSCSFSPHQRWCLGSCCQR